MIGDHHGADIDKEYAKDQKDCERTDLSWLDTVLYMEKCYEVKGV